MKNTEKKIFAEKVIDATGIKFNQIIEIDENGFIKKVKDKKKGTGLSKSNILSECEIIMPGMFDCHVHFQGCDYKIENPLQLPFEERLIKAAISECKQLIDAGFTSVLDAGGMVGLHLRNAINKGILKGPRIYASGRYISPTAGHGDAHYLPLTWMKENRKMGWWPADGRLADGVEECQRAVREQLRIGVDVIKVCGSGTGGKSDIEPWWVPQYTVKELSEMFHIAHSWRKRTMVHAHNPESIKRAVLSGADMITHCSRADKNSIKLLSESSSTVIPTMSMSYKRDRERSFDVINEIHDAGIPLAMGTDTLGYPMKFGENALELEVYVKKIGMTEIEAIQTCTTNSAKALNLPKTGLIEVGNIADLLILKKDPTEDIRILQEKDNILTVIKHGTIIKNID
jgi:imidazolonepropionase-like amidohydrolase